MIIFNRLGFLCAGLLILGLAGRVCGQSATLEAIGVSVLAAETTNLNATGVRVAQVEADTPTIGVFEVNPGYSELPVTAFKYFSTNSSASTFPNSIGAESGHADLVGRDFYGPDGAATNAAHVDNYEAGGFVSVTGFGGVYTTTLPSGNINDPVVSQSFIYSGTTTGVQQSLDTGYDNYAAQYNTLFVSGIGNSGPVSPPATCYNGLGVGAYGGNSASGPTPDNGRAKPDLVAPANETSYSTPLVAGAAAVLIQAGRRGDGGADTNSAVSICTLKALLLNGAIKPPGWTNVSPSPLDVNYGAGVLNLFESYEQLAGGKHGYTVSAAVATGAAHPPTGATGTVAVLSGWDFNTNTSSLSQDRVNHYYFNVTNGVVAARFNATATLAWNRHQNSTAINNLELFLYNTANNSLVASSVSTVDNIQQLWVPQLPAGRYDLQVWKAGGLNTVSYAEPYAVAYEFVDTAATASRTPAGATISWPVYPAGYVLASSTNLSTPLAAWNTNYPLPTVNQRLNQVAVPASAAAVFFRLVRP